MNASHEETSSGTVLHEVKPMHTRASHAMPRWAPVRLGSRAWEQPFCYASCGFWV